MKKRVALLAAVLLAPTAWAQTADPQKKWDEAVAAGKREGKVVIVGSPDPVMRNKIIPAFTARYGIHVEYLAGSSGTLASRIKVERSSGLYSVDVYMAGNDTTANVLYGEKMIDPLKLLMIQPETVDPLKWKSGKLHFIDPEEQYVLRLFRTVANAFFINADRVKPEEIRSVEDLVNPRWKGKISTEDPASPGSGISGAGKLYHDMGPEFVKKLYIDQDPLVSRDRRLLSDSLARGTHPICLTCRADDVAELQKAGFNLVEIYDLAGLPARVRGGPFFLTVANKAPNPHAAQVFLNWIAGKEALEIYSHVYGEVTLRTDVDESFLDPRWVPRPGTTYRDEAEFAWITTGRKESMDKARALLNAR
jgi:iron(III) transport system substrate-binding protein